MLILHANWIRGRLWLWGETSLKEASMDSEVSPFSLEPRMLAAVVKALCGGARRPLLRARHARKVVASLPVFNKQPIPSKLYFMPSDWPLPPEGENEFGPVTIYALPLSYIEAATLFSTVLSCSDPAKSLARNAGAGGDLIALSRVWKLVGAIVSRERILPGVEGNRSRWQQAMDWEGCARRDAVLSAIPPSAYCIERASKPIEFFDDAIDIQMRHAVSTVLTRLHARKHVFYDLHSAYLSSLRTNCGIIRWNNADEIDAFAKQLKEWRLPVEYMADASQALGFRIHDPKNPTVDDPRWTLSPVVISGGKATPLTAEYLSKIGPKKAKRILVALGQASQIAPEIPADGSTGSGGAGAINLDAASLHTFLKEDAPELRAAGFQVYAPSWFSQSKHGREKLVLKASEVNFKAGTGLFSLDSLLDVKWEVVLGGNKLAASDISWMLSSGSPIVRFAGRWIAIDAKELKAAQEKLDRLMREPISLKDLVKLGIGAGMDGNIAVEIDPDAIPSSARNHGLLSMLEGGAKFNRIEIPDGFNGTLREYQRRGLDWLTFLYSWGFGACLADDMGLGKTIEAISAFLSAKKEGMTGPILVVCPMSIMLKWSREISAFAPKLNSWIYHGPDRPRKEAFTREVKKHDICITSYQMLCSEYASIKSINWGIVALDEAQNIKNPRTSKSRAARSLTSTWRLALTGTPVENSVGDIWAMMDFLNPGLLSDQANFVERFQRPIATGSDPEANNELRKLTSPFILRRLKTDPEIVSDMPPKIEEKVYCALTKEQAELYASEVQGAERGLSEKKGIARHGAVLALLTRLKQICNHPQQYLHVDEKGDMKVDDKTSERSGKLARLDEMLSEVLQSGECALVFTQYAVMGELLAKHLSERFGFDVPFLHGEVPVKRRDEMVDRFQRPDGPPIFVLSIKVGGTGLNLTRANHVFHYDRWWNPAVENQATDRAHRIGQNKTVFVHTFICEGTLESHIDDLITGKLELAQKLITSGDRWLSKLDDAGLRKVVELSNEFRQE